MATEGKVEEEEKEGKVAKKFHPQSSGEVIESDDIIVLEHIPIVTPNMDTVVSDLSLEVNRGGGGDGHTHHTHNAII